MQSLVKALKVVDNDDTTKLSLAKDAWNTTQSNSLVAQPIFDWLLSTFAKSSPLLLSRDAWLLLQDLVSPNHVTWLSTSSLSQTPFVVVLKSLLLSLARDLPSNWEAILGPVHTVLRSIWPHVSPRTPAETILECYAAVLNVLAHVPEPEKHLIDIAAVLESSFRTSVSRSQNKKKIYQLFTQHAFVHWVAVASAKTYVNSTHESLVDNIYTSTADLFFAPETLRQAAEQISAHVVIENFREVLVQEPNLLPEVIRLIPRLFASYVSTIRKNASSLFTPAHHQTSADLARLSALSFFESCNTLLVSFPDLADAWVAIASNLNVIRTHAMHKGAADRTALSSCSQAALQVLNGSGSAASSALSALLVLVDLDHDFILPFVEQLLQHLASISQHDTPYNEAVEMLLSLIDHHSRSRTVPVYIDHLCEALSPLHLANEDKYRTVLQSPLFDTKVCDQLSFCVRSFLTPGQIPSYIRGMIQKLGASHSKRGPDEGQESPKKKRKLRVEPSQFHAPPIVLRLAMFILPSIQSDLLKVDLKAELEEEVEEYLTSFPLRATLQSKDWRDSTATVAFLRLRYAFAVSPNFNLNLPSATELWQPLIQTVSSGENTDTELLLECYRLLLLRLSRDPKFSTGFLDPLGDFFEKHVGSQSSADLSAIDLFHVLMDRYLDVIDSSASNAHLDAIVHVLLSSTPVVSPSSSVEGLRKVTLQDVVLQALHSAHFWELPRLRASLLNGILSRLAILDKRADSTLAQLAPLLSTFSLLTNFPLEYLSKNSRAEVSKVAAQLDQLLLDKTASHELASVDNVLTSIRIVLSRVLSSQGSSDTEIIPLKFFKKIVSGSLPRSVDDQTCTSATLDLASLYLGNLLRAHRQNVEQEANLVPAMKILIKRSSFAFVQDKTSDKVADACSLRLIDLVVESSRTEHFSSAAIQCLHDLHAKLTTQLSSAVSALLEKSVVRSPTSAMRILHAWKQRVTLSRWMGCTADSSQFIGVKVVSKLSQEKEGTPVPTELCSLAFAVFLEESASLASFHYAPAVPAAYVSLSHLLTSAVDREAMSAPAAPSMRAMAVDEYHNLFELVAEAVEDKQRGDAHIQFLLEFCIIMLRNCPSGASKAVHQTLGKLSTTFIDGKAFSNGSTSLHLSSLQVISTYCREFAISLRNADIGNVFSILGHAVAPAKQHDFQTSRAMFTTVISILSTLVRLRRDLVIHALPHLGFIVQRLMLCLRHVRPQLGGQQNRMLMDTMPQWISADQGLSAEDAAVLSRLLETLNAKTMFRSTSDTPQKAESLVKPFSKHAAYVLKSYVDAVNDVLCTMPSLVRQELRPGLFAVCHMVSEHNRDALMASALDAGGKATFKGLWKEYEAQKYVGKG